MADWCFSPAYRLYIKTQGKVWSIKTLQSAHCLLQTGQGVNQASLVLADPDGFIANTVAPTPMALVELWSTNRLGGGGVVWSGYVDEVHKAFDPDQGSGVTLACTGPVKLFEITRQSPGDVAGLAMAYARNVAASSVVKFAARSCGYPSSMLNIHPLADSGSGYQQIGAGPLMQPDQQPWSAVVAALQQSSGVEWFFDAKGALFWRQLNFLDPWFPAGKGRPQPRSVRAISVDDVLHADMAQSDQGIVTDVQVRYFGGGGFVQSAANWPQPGKESAAHKTMVAHLRTRRLVVYAPWILQKPHAQYLAQVLYDQYSAGVAQASVTIPADPLIEVGSLVDVPDLTAGGGANQTTRYYVSSITAQLQWGGAWVYTLGLAYGRAPDQSFPYVGTVAFPALTRAVTKDAPRPAGITPYNTSGGPYYDDTPYALVAQSGLAKNQAAVSTAVYPPGSVLYIWTKPHSTGKLIGPAPLGEYTTVAPRDPTQADTTIALASTRDSLGFVTVKTVGTPSAPEIEGGVRVGVSASGSSIAQAAAQLNLPGITNSVLSGEGTRSSGLSAPGVAIPAPASGSLAQRAFALALHYQDAPGRPHYNNDGVHSTGQVGYFGDGQRSFDCAGLVLWCYAQCGYTWGGQVVPQSDGGINYIFPAAGIYQWFAGNHGGRAISVDQAQPADLLFCCSSDDYTQITHVAFCSKAGGFASGEDYGANNWSDGIRAFTIGSERGAPFHFAVAMAGVTRSS